MEFHGEQIIVHSISAMRIPDKFGNSWQYHSRSDRHSKISCWAIMFDLMRHCSLLREHVQAGKVAFGINHELRDFRNNRKKNLDLVLCTGHDEVLTTFGEYGERNGVALTPEQKTLLAGLPVLRRAAVSNVLVALEAKACMTEHGKALPRLHDELCSSHQTIHGDTAGAIAAGYVMVNCADAFISPDRNRKRIRAGKAEINVHKQPAAAIKTLEMLGKIPRRSTDRDHGFDAFGISTIVCRNDHSPIVLESDINSRIPEILTYGWLVKRIAHLYGTKFSAI